MIGNLTENDIRIKAPEMKKPDKSEYYKPSSGGSCRCFWEIAGEDSDKRLNSFSDNIKRNPSFWNHINGFPFPVQTE